MGLHQEYSLVISTLAKLEELKTKMDFIQVLPLENDLGFFPLTKQFWKLFYEKFDMNEVGSGPSCKYYRAGLLFTECEDLFFLVDYAYGDAMVFYKIDNHETESLSIGHDIAWLFSNHLSTRYYIHNDIGGVLDTAMIAAGLYPAGTARLFSKFGFDKIREPEELLDLSKHKKN